MMLCLKKSDGDIVNASVRPSRNRPLNHWAEFNQTCYMTSLRGKAVREQHYFSLLLSGGSERIFECVPSTARSSLFCFVLFSVIFGSVFNSIK